MVLPCNRVLIFTVLILFYNHSNQSCYGAPNGLVEKAANGTQPELSDPNYTGEFANSGAVLKDGKYFCPSLGEFIMQTSDEMSECAYASKAQALCSTNPNTIWRSSSCFCPELNKYFGANRTDSYFIRRKKLSDPNAQSHLNQLASSVPTCPKWIPKSHPFGRSVTLKPFSKDGNEATAFLVEFLPGLKRDNRDDLLGEQGSAEYPAKTATVLGLPLGFECLPSQAAVIFPNQASLLSNIRAITEDVDFYPVEGELTGQRYLTEFIKGRLPIANIEDHGDATFFLHDVDFHVMGFLLLPKMIRELAQKQTRYLLDFIEFFKKQYSEEWKQPKFKLMMERLIEDQISRIDIATGNLSQYLFRLLENETSVDSFFETISKMPKDERGALIATLMAITDGGNGLTEKRSVTEFLESKQYLVLRAFNASDETSKEIYRQALRQYIQLKSSEPEFVEKIKIESYQDVYYGDPPKHGGLDAVNLLMTRIRELKGKSPGIHMDRKSVL